MTMPWDAAGPFLEMLVFEELRRRRHGEGEGGEGEVESLEAQRRQAEEKADDEADEARRPGWSANRRLSELRHQDRRDIGAERVEGARGPSEDLAVISPSAC